MITIREATEHDRDSVWETFHAVMAGRDTYVFDPETPRDEALEYGFQPGSRTYVAEGDGRVVGTYFLKPNRPGLGAHVANAAFMVAPSARGLGVDRAMLQARGSTCSIPSSGRPRRRPIAARTP